MPSLHETAFAQITSRGTNDNGTNNANLSSGAVIVIVLVAAGFLVLVGFATTRFWVSSRAEDDARAQLSGDFSQVRYMREVRLRNHEQIEYIAGARRPMPGPPGSGGQGAGSYDDYSGYPSGYSSASALGPTDTTSRYE